MEENRFALIIACNQYNDTDLRKLESPVYDADALAEVLGNFAIGNFKIHKLINKSSHEIRLDIEKFFANRNHEDLLLFYFSGHGIKDEDGHLYFATADTQRKFLRATAIEASFIKNIMQNSRSRRQVALLDCCYSGAFAGELLAKGDTAVGTNERLGAGKGRIVITASDAMQYAFEGDHIDGKGTPSVFTNILVDGLRTGKADIDGDGHITINELYDYVYNQVIQKTPHQKPERSAISEQGDIIIAKNPYPRETPLPTEIVQAIESPLPSVRATIIDELNEWLRSGNKGKALAAQKALKRLTHDDSRRVSTKALEILSAHMQSQNSGKALGKEGQPPSVEHTPDSPPFVEKKPAPPDKRDTLPPANKNKSRLLWLLPSIIMPFIIIGSVIAIIYWKKDSHPQEPISPVVDKSYKVEEAPVQTQVKPDLVHIPGGYFEMGSSEGEDEMMHEVYVNDFYMGKYEVTVGDFREFLRDTDYRTDAEKGGGSHVYDGTEWKQKTNANWLNPYFKQSDKHPVVCVSWNDAIGYCNWRSQKEGLTPVYTFKGDTISADFKANGYRLPTEAEWEYAARYGKKGYKYSWGDGAPAGKRGGNIADETMKRTFSEWNVWKGYDDGYVYTAPVGSFDSNEFGLYDGLYDMTGNVWEWCWDWYGKDYYKNSPKRNPQGPSSGDGRVVRGGSWGDGPFFVRAALRIDDFPDDSSLSIGIRLSRTF